MTQQQFPFLKKMVLTDPKPGDTIYVPTAGYIDRGEDDVLGGLATIISAS